MAICNSDGEVIGVVQAINKNPIGTPFTEDDEKVRMCYVFSQLGKKKKKKSTHQIHIPEGFPTPLHFIGYLSSSELL